MSRVLGSINQLKLAKQNVQDRIEKVEVDLSKHISFDFFILENEKGFFISDREGNITPIDIICEYIVSDRQYTKKSHINNSLDV